MRHRRRAASTALLLVEEFGPHRLAFCTDDREPEHIAEDGHVNSMVREAVAQGTAPEDALVMATLSPCLWHGLTHLGAVAPGYQADILLLPTSSASSLTSSSRPASRWRRSARGCARVGQVRR